MNNSIRKSNWDTPICRVLKIITTVFIVIIIWSVNTGIAKKIFPEAVATAHNDILYIIRGFLLGMISTFGLSLLGIGIMFIYQYIIYGTLNDKKITDIKYVRKINKLQVIKIVHNSFDEFERDRDIRMATQELDRWLNAGGAL